MDEPMPGPAPFTRDEDGWRSLHFSPRLIQSRMNVRQPDLLDLEYTRMMMGFLMFDEDPARITLIGLGGGSLAKFCHRYLPRAAVTAVEIDPRVIALRRAFMVPDDDARLSVLEADGAAYVARAARGGPACDALLVDGFDEHGMAEALGTQAFYDDCHAMLGDRGTLVVNFHITGDAHYTYLDRIRQSFGSAVFEAMDDDMTNIVVYACKGDGLAGLDAVPRRPAGLAKEGWRQLMPTFKLVWATLTPR